MSLFFIVVTLLGWFMSYYYRSPVVLYVAVIVSIVMNLASYWYSDKIVLKLSGAVPASRDEFPELVRIVENLSITAGLPAPRVYIIRDPSPNAFATGRDAAHAAIAVTTGILGILDRSELEGVIAHELSHVGNRDILLSTVVVVLVGFVALLSDFFLRSSRFGGARGGRESEEGNRIRIILLALGAIFAILSPLIAKLIQLAVSRRREFLADTSGALLTRYPDGLASALRKIADAARPMIRANRATAHLFIASPFAGSRAAGFMSRILATHPPVEERIAALLGDHARYA